MLEANYNQVNNIQPPKEVGAILIALAHLEGEIKNLHCAIDALQEKTAPIAYYPPKECAATGEGVNKSGCLVYEKIENRISELYQLRQRLNSIIEALQV